MLSISFSVSFLSHARRAVHTPELLVPSADSLLCMEAGQWGCDGQCSPNPDGGERLFVPSAMGLRCLLERDEGLASMALFHHSKIGLST